MIGVVNDRLYRLRIFGCDRTYMYEGNVIQSTNRCEEDRIYGWKHVVDLAELVL